MKIMGFRMFRRNTAQSACPGIKVVWQFRANSLTDKRHSEPLTSPAEIALSQKADFSTQQQHLRLDRDKILGQALKQYGIKFVR